MSQANHDAKEDFEKFINTIFKLIEVDKWFHQNIKE
jgi:hypothetical protein